MCSSKHVFLWTVFILYAIEICESELIQSPPHLVLYSPGEPEYTDILVKRLHDNLTLVCELRGDIAQRVYIWNYVAGNISDDRPFTIQPIGPTRQSTLMKQDLQLGDSGQYFCSVPPFSATKTILVQMKGPKQCARGAFWCGLRCVLAAYVCDGQRDCTRGEDEQPALCGPQPCTRPDKLNCSTGRCMSESACCRAGTKLCKQPTCCDEHPRFSMLEGYMDLEYPALYEDRHPPDDYGFIQSTIYTVTACALIFMIAVLLLVSAICKMHMKRTALRTYCRSDAAHYYSMQYAPAPRYPPCYEASRLLHENASNSPAHSPLNSPTRQNLQCSQECPAEDSPSESMDPSLDNNGFGLTRLSSIFSSRYRQVPTSNRDVELTDVRPSSLNNSPSRNIPRTRLDNYRSPTYCDLNTTEFLFTNPESPSCGRDLNYMATPLDVFRRRTLRSTALERVVDQIERARPLTLHLGRFQLSIPRFSRSTERRPDTPNVAEINIEDLDFVRLESNDTYTLNGRTIRLLGANFENYPGIDAARPPPYTEAMRYKLCGPPPEYLSRDTLNNEVDDEARSNIEMPPCYEDTVTTNTTVITADIQNNNAVGATNDVQEETNDVPEVTSDIREVNRNNLDITNNATLTNTSPRITDNGNDCACDLNSVIDTLPAIDCDVNANGSV